jgi:acyl-CoA synthetase (AMP-forming)/AMP-acid ligase II
MTTTPSACGLAKTCPQYAEALRHVTDFHDFPTDITVDALFSDQVVRSSGNVAVEVWSSLESKVAGCWTYSELSTAVVSIADTLKDAGIGRGHAVGLLLPRGVHAIAAAFALSRIGATLVNIDPAWPETRITVPLTCQ